MIDVKEQLSARLRERASLVDVRPDLDGVRDGVRSTRFEAPGSSGWRWRLPVVVAAAAAVAVVGFGVVANLRPLRSPSPTTPIASASSSADIATTTSVVRAPTAGATTTVRPPLVELTPALQSRIDVFTRQVPNGFTVMGPVAPGVGVIELSAADAGSDNRVVLLMWPPDSNPSPPAPSTPTSSAGVSSFQVRWKSPSGWSYDITASSKVTSAPMTIDELNRLLQAMEP